jgi:hypothetical protein
MTGFLFFSLIPLIVMHWRQRQQQQQLKLQLQLQPRQLQSPRQPTPIQGHSRLLPTPSLSKEFIDFASPSFDPLPPPPAPAPALLAPHTRQVSLDGHVEQTEILLHNISHSDLVISLDEEDTIFARPKFSCFRGLSETMYRAIREMTSLQLVNYSVHTRDNKLAKRPIRSSSGGAENVPAVVPVGFDFKELAQSDMLALDNLDQLRFRHKDKEKLSSAPGAKHKISAAFFPLLAALVPKWESYILERGKYKANTKLVLFLISGQGTPRDEAANVVDNSTDLCAHLMKAFLQKAYPYIEVRLLPSPNLNLFRYDENIQFVKQILLPHVESIRSEIVREVADRWKDHMHMYIS